MKTLAQKEIQSVNGGIDCMDAFTIGGSVLGGFAGGYFGGFAGARYGIAGGAILGGAAGAYFCYP
ncbi:hypothetical protein D1814_06850 [Alteromonas sp. BL110]|uniref:Blp family class II bacteriocin n=1 Tax=Alteromonas sp. BL110 TaxID=1714845 RepID=UPI000E5444F7|nr:Blp family class II bacteriocin [Alteromonas sp. BL110]AXT38409.1 hypothetical protein D1814_06850 [Alteromonas sp. BL110]RKM83847.1 hypothetical protein D7031_02080 [Alteromonas sp. BL110]